MLIGNYGASIIIMPKEIENEIEYDYKLDNNDSFHIQGIRNFLHKYQKNFKVSKSVNKDIMSFNYALELVMQGCIVIEIVVNNGYASALYVPEDVSKITVDQIKWLRNNKKDLENLFKSKYLLIKVLSKDDYESIQTYSLTEEERLEILKDYFKECNIYKDEDENKVKGEIKC